MDTHEQIAFESEICAGVLGRAGEFVLIRLDQDEAGKQEALEGALSRGFVYCGVLGLKNGTAAVQSEPDPDALYTMMRASLAFGQFVAERIGVPPQEPAAPETGDAAEWLARLASLPDTRD